jgi:uncharacterized membrane protein YhaH (DUF805 family)
MRYLLRLFKKTFDFKTRASRKEFFISLILLGVPFLLESIVVYGIIYLMPESTLQYLLIGAMALFVMDFTLLAFYSLVVRRLHDAGRTGWLGLLCAFPPVLGALIPLFYCLQPGTVGPNKYGDDPRELGW